MSCPILFYPISRGLSSWFRITFGGNAILYDIDRGEILPLGEESSRKPVILGTENGIEGGIHISDQVQVNERLSIYAGLRYSFYAYLGPQTVYEYVLVAEKPRSPVQRLTTR